MAVGEKGREPRAASLLVSLTFHVLAGLGIAVGSWWWGAPTLEVWKTHTVSLVDAPLSLQQPVALPPTTLPKVPSLPPPAMQTPEPPKAPSPPQPAIQTPEPPKAPSPPKVPKAEVKPAVKTPVPSRKSEAAKPARKPKAKSPSRAKPAPAKPAQAPLASTSREARSAIEALRQRQAKRDQEKQAETTRRQAALARVAALRDQLKQEETVGRPAVTATGVQRVRLMAYQDRLQGKIIKTWILPLSAEQTRDLQATAQFQVTRTGKVVQLELVKPSGNTLFDASLLRAIRRASPLPALPDDYPDDILEVEMRFRPNS